MRFIFLSFIAATNFAYAATSTHHSAPKLASFASDNIADYQIGALWGKKVVTKDTFKNENEVFKKTVLRTAHLFTYEGIGTAFYLGKFNGHHIMATNYHLLKSAWEFQKVIFDFYDKTLSFEKFYGSWPHVDFALFAIKATTQEDEEFLNSLATNMAFKKEIFQGEPLLTIGYGNIENPEQALVANQDSDCMVYSQNNEFKLMNDSDGENPVDYSAWSFANGCDVSHGDSGSAMVDRTTGEIVGIIWTAKLPKDRKVQDPSYLKQVYQAHSQDIWTQLSYSVPATKIYEALSEWTKTPTLDVDTGTTLREIIK